MSGNKVLVISGPHKKMGRYRKLLVDNGFSYPDSKGYIKAKKTFSPREKRKLRYFERKFSRTRGISCDLIDEKYTRSTDYRSEYFRNNRPSPGGQYRCIYCGRYFPKDRITVDHIIPVYAAEHSTGTRIAMGLLGLNSINDVRNLGAACSRCNKKKGKKTGLWVIRGALGKTRWFWILRFLFWFTIAVAAIGWAARNGWTF